MSPATEYGDAPLLLLSFVTILPATCGDDPSASGPALGGADVRISGFAFDPASLDVAAGTTVTIVNDDEAAHTLTAKDGSFDSGEIAGGETATVRVDGSGTVDYVCDIHQYMRASFEVS